MRAMTANEAITFTRATEKMLADPDLTDRALVLAIALRAHFSTGRKEVKFSEVRKMLGWTVRQMHSTLRDDAPRYEPDRTRSYECANPMIRRDGQCGRPTSWKHLDFRDVETGEVTVRGACSRHWPELQSQHRANRADWLAAGKPTPGPNKGGVLPRYFSTDWRAVYRESGALWLEGDDVPEVAPSAPALTIVPTIDPDLTPPARPALTVITGETS